MVQDDETLYGAVAEGSTSQVNEAADRIKAGQREIGREIAEKLGQDTTFDAFQEELKVRRFSIVYGEEVRAGFDAYRAEQKWQRVKSPAEL